MGCGFNTRKAQCALCRWRLCERLKALMTNPQKNFEVEEAHSHSTEAGKI